MDDRELLEMAAKAAGHLIDPIDAMHEPDDWACWNPLTDDGDALRLAVKLHLDLRFHWDGCDDQYDEVEAYTHGAGKDAREQIGFYERDGQLDEPAATRRAIVRAAAEIGRAM